MNELAQAFPDSDDLEPRIAEVLAHRLVKRTRGPYRCLDEAETISRLENFLARSGQRDFSISSLGRMAGGASKEQFSFILESSSGLRERMVLRIDPLESIIETCRYREAEVLAAMVGQVPVARVCFLDGDGMHLGQPGMITSFVKGVAKPPMDDTVRVSGVGTAFSRQWRERLAPQFISNLARIHGFEWKQANLPHFSAPTAFPRQAALWAVNWWANVWRHDLVEHYPVFSLAERWMREHLPPCNDPVLLHGDYRTGNFLFDAETGEMSAVLDWELTHIGDFHEDLGWILQRLFAGPAEDGVVLACSLLPREELIQLYEAATGRTVNRETLAFYEVLAAYKCGVMNLGTSFGVTLRQTNHQDILLSLLASVGHVFISEIVDIIHNQGLGK